MRSREQVEAKLLVRNIERLDEARKAGASTDVIADAEGLARRAQERIRHIAAAVLSRELGIQRFMVVEVERADGYTRKLQVLRLDLDADNSRWWKWRWSLHGRALRKDGTLGTGQAGTIFSSAKIKRRTLEGTWKHLEPLIRCWRRRESVSE